MTCDEMSKRMPDLLLGPELEIGSVSVAARETNRVAEHMAGCSACTQQLAELRATMALMEEWKAPEPNPYFMTRLAVRLEEEREAVPASWWEKMRARFMYGSRMTMRPVAAMAMTVMLLVGGGAYLGLTTWDTPGQNQATQTAVVHDLQTLDNNAQLLDQLETMSTQAND